MAIITAASTSQADVATAIAAASDGDRVDVPAGDATWSTKISITNKAITLHGAGIGNTTITSGISTLFHNAPIFIDASGKAVRVTGFSFVGGAGDQEGFIEVLTSAGFRIDNCDFSNLTKRGILAYATATSYGVVDHCTFTKPSTSTVVTPQGVAVSGDGDTAWNRTLALGAMTSAVYVEDCTFTWGAPNDSVMDCYNGGKIVFRYNTVNGANIGTHGTDSGTFRSPVSWEFYNNTMVLGAAAVAFPVQIRGGTGVVYNNTVTCSHIGTSTEVLLTDYRATGTFIGNSTFSKYAPWGRTGYWDYVTETNIGTTLNAYDGNTDAYGYPGLDQIGACPPTTPSDISSNRPAVNSVQGHQSAYAWNNTYNGSAMPMAAQVYAGTGYPDGSVGNPNVATMIQENRDFVNGIAMPGYTALAYPHPLAFASPTFTGSGSAAFTGSGSVSFG